MAPSKEYQFKNFYLKQAPRLIAFARRFVDYAEAEDVVHDVFLKIWKQYPEKIQKDGIESYLHKMVRNACYDYLKHVKVEENFLSKTLVDLKMEELKWSDSHEGLLSYEDKLSDIYVAIEKLPPKCKQIFVKAYLEEQRHIDIAQALNISVRTVETQVYKALRLLRETLLPFLLLFVFFS